MLAKTDVAKIYETVLSIPGMSEPVKIALTIPRKNVLLLSKIIERGLAAKDADDKSTNILDIVPKETSQELLSLASELLNKSGLTELNQKLQTL
ncbi:MAG: hypothetical protein ABIN01_05940 [Ferruginibacter sp.]